MLLATALNLKWSWLCVKDLQNGGEKTPKEGVLLHLHLNRGHHHLVRQSSHLREKTGTKTSKVSISGNDSSLEKKLGQNHSSGKDSPQFADCDVQQLWCCLLLGEDEASDKRESLIIINCRVGDKFGIDQIFVGGSYLLGYIWRHEVSFLGHHVLLLIDIA